MAQGFLLVSVSSTGADASRGTAVRRVAAGTGEAPGK